MIRIKGRGCAKGEAVGRLKFYRRENKYDFEKLTEENEALRNQYVVDAKAVGNAKKNILTEDEFKNKATTSFNKNIGPLEFDPTRPFANFENRVSYAYENDTYSNYNDYVKKTLAYMYETGEIPNEASLNALLDHFNID